MISKRIEFQLKVGGVGQVLPRVVLRSEDGTWAVRRLNPDHDLVLAADPLDPNTVAMLPEFAGSTEYVYTLNNLLPVREYEYRIEYDYNGDTDSLYRTFATPDVVVGEPVSIFTSYEAFRLRWGTKNIAEASEPDSKAIEPNLAAVQEAFSFADDEIQDELRGGVLAVPLDFTPWGGIVPRKVQGWAQVLAFGYLYEKRGWQEKKTLKNKVVPLMERTYHEMQLVKNGIIQINAAPAVDSDGDTVTRAVTTVQTWYRWYRYPDGVWLPSV
jgi:hypothetical protein